ncbi:hypothetical protein [Dactylosporangium darangshiense]|uniref:Uncharacterized protein n=1 Tax=Dactylosporangium darangshiense TaxID=579108 RepID=A0ABP8CU26_9ACTN
MTTWQRPPVSVSAGVGVERSSAGLTRYMAVAQVRFLLPGLRLPLAVTVGLSLALTDGGESWTATAEVS